MKFNNLIITALDCILNNINTHVQVLKDGKFKLNENGSYYVKFTMVSKIWLRTQNLNPGSTVFKYAKNNSSDIGIRSYRIRFMGQPTDFVLVYIQIGENNFYGISDRKLEFFVHDALGEYAVVITKLSLCGGLTTWSGLARFASPSVGSIMRVNAPLYQQSTNDITDQFMRKLSVYAKGKIGKLDYRVVIFYPLTFQKSSSYSGVLKPISNFSSKPPQKQLNTYLQYQFKAQKSNLTPYMTGTYLGKKKVFNIGVGLVYQKAAKWHITENLKDTASTNMLQLATDLYYDAPLEKDRSAISIYGNAKHFDFGPNYTRSLAVMNPDNGTTNTNLVNGSGNGFPAFGTGNLIYTQIGIKSKDNLIGNASLMPYASIQHAVYEKLKTQMNFFDLGVNVLLAVHTSKLTVAYQNRPLYNIDGVQKDRRGAEIVQYQAFFN